MDIEDSHKLKILSLEETEDLLLGFFDEEGKQRIRNRIDEEGVTDVHEKVVYMRACVISLLERKCVEAFVANEQRLLDGTLEGCLIDHISPLERDAYHRCEKVSRQKIYNSKPVLDVELSGYNIMETLLTALVEAAVEPQRYYSRQLIQRFSSQYDINSPNLETRIQAVIDYISGMTDLFALDVYQKIKGISLPIV